MVEYLKLESFGLSNNDCRHKKVIDMLDEKGFKPLSVQKDDPVEFLASFKLGIKVFRTNYFLFTGKTSRKGSNRAMVADSSKDIKGWLLVNNLFC